MNEKEVKYALYKTALPCAILLLVLGILFTSFSLTAISEAKKTVMKRLRSDLLEQTSSMKDEVSKMTDLGVPIARLATYKTTEDLGDILCMGKTLVDYSNAYLAVFANEKGQGVTNGGKNVDLSNVEYLKRSDNLEQEYIYVADDGITQKSAVISSIALIKNNQLKGSLYIYYPSERLHTSLENYPSYGQNMIAIIKSDGTIIASTGSDLEGFCQDTNFLDKIKTHLSDKEFKDLKRKISNGGDGNFSMQFEGKGRKVLYAPLKMGDWYLFVGVNSTYFDKQVSAQWQELRSLITLLILILFIFIVSVVALIISIRVRYTKESKTLENKADTDLLTDLYNKIATEREIKKYIQANPDAKGIMFIIDIDNFKKINDTMGHAFGDEVLRKIGIRLQTTFRVSDIVGRTGGDEFIIFLKDITSECILEKEMKKLSLVFQDFRSGDYVKYSVTASIGCALLSRDGNSFETLYKAADRALYHAKKRGKNQIVVYGDHRD